MDSALDTHILSQRFTVNGTQLFISIPNIDTSLLYLHKQSRPRYHGTGNVPPPANLGPRVVVTTSNKLVLGRSAGRHVVTCVLSRCHVSRGAVSRQPRDKAVPGVATPHWPGLDTGHTSQQLPTLLCFYLMANRSYGRCLYLIKVNTFTQNLDISSERFPFRL